jgi:hypothetical protein
MLPSTGLKRDVTATPGSPSSPTATRVHAKDAAVTGLRHGTSRDFLWNMPIAG